MGPGAGDSWSRSFGRQDQRRAGAHADQATSSLSIASRYSRDRVLPVTNPAVVHDIRGNLPTGSMGHEGGDARECNRASHYKPRTARLLTAGDETGQHRRADTGEDTG